MKRVLKSAVNGSAIVCVFPMALLSAFGRFPIPFSFFAQLLALFPGLPGDYLRTAYYVLTLRRCSLQSRVSFGTFFAQSSVTVERNVYIGAYCVLGSCHIGERTQIASQVQILSGRRQHARNSQGQILGSDHGLFQAISIGADCWIGAAAIIMEDVGAGSTIGAGAVVTRPIPPNTVAVGNPAKPISQRVKS